MSNQRFVVIRSPTHETSNEHREFGHIARYDVVECDPGCAQRIVVAGVVYHSAVEVAAVFNAYEDQGVSKHVDDA